MYINIKDEKGEYLELSIDEASTVFGFSWLEWRFDEIESIVADDDYPVSLSAIQQIDVQSIYEHLEIRYMDERCGWGLFSRKPIPKNSVIGLFTGKMEKKTMGRDYKSSIFYDLEKDSLILNGDDYGNYMHFIQHLPSFEDLEDWGDIEETKESIAVENLYTIEVRLSFGIVSDLFITSDDIEADCLLGCSYSITDDSFSPLLFLKDGTIVESAINRKESKKKYRI